MTAAATYILGLSQGGSDITGALSSAGVRVHAKSGGARTCNYTYEIIGGGAVDLTALVGAAVSVTVDTGGGAEVVFTGNVNRTPVYDTSSRTLSVQATDNWQEYLDGKTQAELESLIPAGLYRVDLEGERQSGMQQALAMLSTTPEDAFLTRAGVFATASWTPKASGSEDHVLAASEIQEVTPQLVDADVLINTVTMTYRHTFTRRVWNKVDFSWLYGDGVFHQPWSSWCDWYLGNPRQGHGHDLPTQDEITTAAQGTGWGVIGGIHFTGHPDNFGPGTGHEPCGPGVGWLLSDYFKTEAIAAVWDGGQTYAVEARETLDITLTAASSVSAYGSRTAELSFAADTPYAADAVDADSAPQEPSGFTIYGSGGNQSYSDEIDATERTANLEAALAKARNLILSSHRKNTVTWTQLISPAMDLGQTVTATHPLATCRGVIVEMIHVIARASARTIPTIAAYIGGGGTDDALTAPAMTVSPPTEEAPSAVVVPNHIGNMPASDEYDSDWEEESGWVANVPSYICFPGGEPCPDQNQLYVPTAFRVRGPDIPASARVPAELSASPSYAIAIPATTITVSGG